MREEAKEGWQRKQQKQEREIIKDKWKVRDGG